VAVAEARMDAMSIAALEGLHSDALYTAAIENGKVRMPPSMLLLNADEGGLTKGGAGGNLWDPEVARLD
jgi:hypothetical protein